MPKTARQIHEAGQLNAHIAQLQNVAANGTDPAKRLQAQLLLRQLGQA